MSKDDSAASRLSVLRAKQEELSRQYDENIRWLREVATFCCSTEEQQRIVGDIDEIREELIRGEEAIWKLEHRGVDDSLT